MGDGIRGYYRDLIKTIGSISATDGRGAGLDFHESIAQVCGVITGRAADGKKVILVGNGGSAGIASHMALDFWKNGGIRAVDFGGNCLLTCIGNDFGYEHVFAKPILMFADPGDVVIAISSSGRSPNIINAVEAARSRQCHVITMSGFDPANPLRAMGEVNYYVPSGQYGPVEVTHQIICHSILDAITGAL